MSKRLKLTVRAHAKVNLDLRVLGVRADGYHELRTVFQAIEAGAVHAEVPQSRRSARCEQSRVEGGGGAVDGARARR
jgi:4-diphosphocytidyl-2C-methyl-D-erythritol kinase